MNSQSLIEVNPRQMSGMPIFHGTRVPIQNFFDCLEEGEPIDQFLDQLPTVSANRLTGVLKGKAAPSVSRRVNATRFIP
jgi:uncharacterized protein (DUF433 family)